MFSSQLGQASGKQKSGTLIDLSSVTPALASLAPLTEWSGNDGDVRSERREDILRNRLALDYRLNERSLLLLPDIDEVLATVVEQTTGPLVVFPPSTVGDTGDHAVADREVVEIARGFGRDRLIPLDFASDLPPDGVALIASPGDPLGGLLAANDAVRLARSCQWLIVDERHADYAGQSLLSLASEFSNVLVVRSFRATVGGSRPEAGWVVGSPSGRNLLARVSATLRPAIIDAALASANDRSATRANMALVREERSRLYRMLRKLSYLQPLPSWGPFVAARVEVGERETLLGLLATRGIRVHAPQSRGLERYVRIGIGARTEMDCLRRALLEIAPAMLGEQLASSGGHPYRFPLSGEEFSESQFGEVEERRQRSA